MMKAKLYLLLLPLSFVLFTKCDKIHPDDPIDIPDQTFLTALIEEGVDTNGDGLISFEEAEVITYIDVSDKGISDLSGIESFVNLDTLYCYSNQLTYVDISNNTSLLFLNCFSNQLTYLDISNNTSLENLDCGHNQLANLVVSNNTALEFFWCGSNRLNYLDISHNTALKWFWCDYNRLTNLDISYNAALISLNCGYNQLTNLDISNNTSLRVLTCQSNQLANLDVSNNNALTVLWCSSNQLTFLDISKNSNLGVGVADPGYFVLDIGLMPRLQKVCVWTMPFPPEGLNIYKGGSPNVYFTTECSK